MENQKLFNLMKETLFEENPNVLKYESRGILKELGLKENTFGSSNTKELMKMIVDSPYVYKNFAILASSTCIFMGYSWICDEKHGHNPHWDERKYASQEFCHKNYELFQNIFLKYTGCCMPMVENPNYISFLRDCQLNKKSVLYNELADFTREHSTIQQKMIGTFIRALSEKEPELAEYRDLRFPFI